MATVHNAYYNSPWIEKAAANLASALAPPDPEKMMAKQKLEWELARAQEVAKLEDEQYANTVSGNESLAKVLQLTANPVRNPLTDEIDDVETERQVLQHLSDAIGRGGINFVNPGLKAAGPAAPTFAVSEALAQQKAGFASNQIDQRLAGALQVLGITEGGKDRRLASSQAFTLDRDNKNYQYKLGLEADRHENRIKEKRAAAASPGAKPPRMLSRAAMEDIIYGFDLKEEELGGRQIPKKYKDKMIEEAEDIVQKGGKVQTAINAVWSKRKLDDVPAQKRKRFFGMEYGDLDPVIPAGYDEETPVAVDPSSLGGAAIGAGAAQPTRDAPASSTPPVRVLKEGVPRKFPANGQVWELRNGVPLRRTDLED